LVCRSAISVKYNTRSDRTQKCVSRCRVRSKSNGLALLRFRLHIYNNNNMISIYRHVKSPIYRTQCGHYLSQAHSTLSRLFPINHKYIYIIFTMRVSTVIPEVFNPAASHLVFIWGLWTHFKRSMMYCLIHYFNRL